MTELKLSGRMISTKLDALVMGIVNVTPDSFHEKSRGGIELAKRLIEEGADIIDLGAESTRPGSDYISEEEEIRRLIPVIKEIRKISDIPLSIDTRKYEVMKAAFEEGADILNDISAMEDDPRLFDFCAQTKIPVILMHKRGIPSSMQKNTDYSNCFEEVDKYLSERARLAEEKGIESEKIILDPGIGFGKSVEDNFLLMKNCGKLCQGRYKVLMALSRKSCIGAVTGRETADRLCGSVSADLLSVLAGASLIRVHDVKEAVDSLKVLKAFNGA